jgi:hypothetical protein
MSGCSVPQHGVELRLGHCRAVMSEAPWATGYWWARCGAYVVRCVVPHLTMDLRWLGERREFLQEAVRESVSSNDFHAVDCRWLGKTGRGK